MLSSLGTKKFDLPLSYALTVERVTLYVVDNSRILGNTIVVKHSL